LGVTLAKNTALSIFTDLFVSSEGDALTYERYASSRSPPPQFERFQFRGLLDINFGILWALLEGKPWQVDSHSLRELALTDGGTRWLFQFPAPLVNRLASLTVTDMSAAAGAWARTEELNCQPSELEPVVAALVQLSQHALAPEKGLYLWGSL
jgi:hypothetical protein